VAKAVAKPVARPRGVNLHDTALARALRGASFRTAARSAGGMTPLLRQSQFAAQAAGRTAARGMLAGAGASLRGGAAPSDGSVAAGSVAVASFGGGGGSGGGGGIHGVSSPGYGRGSHAAVNGQGRSFVSLDTGASDVAEGLTKDQVGAVIHRHMSEIRYCYEAAMLRQPDVEGKLSVAFTIDGRGQVAASHAAGSSLADRQLDHCVVSRLATWKFPKPRGGVRVAVNYPFIFKTLGR
jgi:outer membrane biosynthesis protein TonB